MKKLIFIAAAVLMLSSCVRDNFIFETNYVEPLVWSDNITVTRNMWEFGIDEMNNIYFWYEREVPQLNREVWRYGQMQAFFVTPRGSFIPLPFSEFIYDNGALWEEHFTVEFSQGLVTFILRFSDLADAPTSRPSYTFHVRFLW